MSAAFNQLDTDGSETTAAAAAAATAASAALPPNLLPAPALSACGQQLSAASPAIADGSGGGLLPPSSRGPPSAGTPSTPSSDSSASSSSSFASADGSSGIRRGTRIRTTPALRQQPQRRAAQRSRDHAADDEEEVEETQRGNARSSATPSDESGDGDDEFAGPDVDSEADAADSLSPAGNVEDEDEPPAVDPSAAHNSNSVVHCGRVNDAGVREYRQHSPFFATVVDIGGGESTVPQQLVNVYTCEHDGHQRTLYCCGDLAKRFESSSVAKRMNKVGMWMSRRRSMHGVYQASAIQHKQLGPGGKVGLKTTGYFFTLAVAKKYQTHVMDRRKNMKPGENEPTEKDNSRYQKKAHKRAGAAASSSSAACAAPAPSPTSAKASSSSKRATSTSPQSARPQHRSSNGKISGTRKESPTAAASAKRPAKKQRRSISRQSAQLHTASEPESFDDDCDASSNSARSSAHYMLTAVSNAAELALEEMGSRHPAATAVLATTNKKRRKHRKMESVKESDRPPEVNGAFASAVPVMAQIIGQPLPHSSRSTSAGFSVPASPASASSMPMTLAQPRLSLAQSVYASTPSMTRALAPGGLARAHSSKSEGAPHSSPSSSSASLVGGAIVPFAPLPLLQPQTLQEQSAGVVKLEEQQQQQQQQQQQHPAGQAEVQRQELMMMQMQQQQQQHQQSLQRMWLQQQQAQPLFQPVFAGQMQMQGPYGYAAPMQLAQPGHSFGHATSPSSTNFIASSISTQSTQSQSLYYSATAPPANYAFNTAAAGRMLPVHSYAPQQLAASPMQLQTPGGAAQPQMHAATMMQAGGAMMMHNGQQQPQQQPYGVYLQQPSQLTHPQMMQPRYIQYPNHSLQQTVQLQQAPQQQQTFSPPALTDANPSPTAP